MSWEDGMLRVGIGIPTYNRPEFLKRAVESVDKFCEGKLSQKVIYDDGSTEWDEEFYESLPEKGWTVMRSEDNMGVAHAKSQLLEFLMSQGMDMFLLMEDDIVMKSDMVIDAYASVIQKTGIQHLNFAHHGTANIGRMVEANEDLELWENVIGAFSVYTRKCLELVGNIDPAFRNDLDHVHHTYMIALNGLTTPWRAFADIRGSDRLLGEQDGAIEQSTIVHDDIFEVDSSFQKSLRHWMENYPFPNDLTWLLR